jgi:hypothetical protein
MGSSAALLLRGRHRLPAPIWSAGLVGLVAFDLFWFAVGFNPVRPVSQLLPTGPVVQALRERNGLHRVFIEPALYGYLGPNQLVGLEINHAGGYSSLEPRRAMDYFWSIVRQDNVLLDLFNVRYVVSPRAPGGALAAFEGTLFHPADRLLRGSVDNPAGTETFQVRPWWTRSLTLVSHSDGFIGLPYGTPIAEITLAGPDGEQRVVVSFGPDVDDRQAPLLGPWTNQLEGRPARIAWTGPSFQNPKETKILFGSELPLERPIMVTSVTIRRVGPPGLLTVLGLGLNDREGLPPLSVTPADRAKYRQVYQDQDLVVYENAAALPRAFFVHEARTPTGGSETLVDEMLLGSFDPRQAILVESPVESPPLAARAEEASGNVQVIDYRPEQVRVAVDQPEPGYLVLTDRLEDGWSAVVDGAPVPLMRADALFRAVPVPAGRHEVLFNYEPLAVRVGMAIAAATLTLVLLLALTGRSARRPV